MKPPAFQFYAADFLVGSAALSNEEKGIYIVLLCYQWMHGHIPKDRKIIARLAGCPPKKLESVLSKFSVDSDGNFYNVRLESERQKQESFRAKQAENGSRGGRPTHNPEERLGLSGQNPKINPNASQTKALQSSFSPSGLISPQPPKGGAVGVTFGDFWALYPKRKNKERAMKAWAKLTPDERALALAALPAHIASPDWHRVAPDGGDFIPHGASWLNGKRWEDELKGSYIPAKPKAPPKPAPPPPPWLESLNRILAIRKNKPDAKDLATFERLRIAQVLETLPYDGWQYLNPEEYNYFKPILREYEEVKKERATTLSETAPPTSIDKPDSKN